MLNRLLDTFSSSVEDVSMGPRSLDKSDVVSMDSHTQNAGSLGSLEVEV
jgi:hypothetical protein